MKRGECRGRIDPTYNHPMYKQIVSRLENAVTTIPFGNIIESISGGATPLRANDEQYCDSGIKFLRIQNITPLGFDFSDIKYITEIVHNNLLKRSQLQENDLLMTITGRIGTCAVVNKDCLPANINQHIVRIRLKKGYDPYFVAAFLNSDIGLLLSNRGVTGTTRIALDYESIKQIPFPDIDINKQYELNKKMENALRQKNNKLKEANEYITMKRKHLFHELNIDFLEYTPHLFSFTKLSDVKKLGIYCNPHSSYLRQVFLQLSNHSWCHGVLKDFVDINPPIDKTELTNETQVSFVPMTNVGEKNNKVLYEIKDYQEVKTGFTPFMRGDLLWAKITPCMQNGKSFISDNMPTKYGFGSTELHVLRSKNENLYLPYLWVLLSDSHILEAAQGMFSGSAGQQRVTDVFLKNFPVVLPPYNLQVELADKVFSSLQEAYLITQQAEQEWQAAKKQFEKELLGE